MKHLVFELRKTFDLKRITDHVENCNIRFLRNRPQMSSNMNYIMGKVARLDPNQIKKGIYK